jgi:hypothetical protein
VSAIVTLAAAWALRLSNHFAYGEPPSSETYLNSYYLPVVYQIESQPMDHYGISSGHLKWQMPVIRHQTIRRNPYIGSLDDFAENFLKGTIVCGFFEQRQPTDPSV